MRACARCGRSVEDYRPQAVYCSGACRAAASRARAAERREPTAAGRTLPQNRTETAQGLLETALGTAGLPQLARSRAIRMVPAAPCIFGSLRLIAGASRAGHASQTPRRRLPRGFHARERPHEYWRFSVTPCSVRRG
jgi:hypothetical protein